MKRLITEEKFKLAVRWALGLVFVAAGILKLFDPQVLAGNLKGLPFVPDALLMPIVYAFRLLEIAIRTALIIKMNNCTLIVYMSLLGVFCIYLGYKVITNDPSSCGCMGKAVHQSNVQSLIQNLFLLMGGVWLYDEKVGNIRKGCRL